MIRRTLMPQAALLLVVGSGLGGCGTMTAQGQRYAAATDERECLVRAMYFESNRSSLDGQLAVGTVVMNRLDHPSYPKTICGVVGQKNQFAPGALTEPLTSRALPKVQTVADAVLAGARHPTVGRALWFHTAGYHYPYKNMHYMVVAGGNAFYDRRRNPTQTQTMVAQLEPREKRVALAALETPFGPRPGSLFDFEPATPRPAPEVEREPETAAAPEPVRDQPSVADDAPAPAARTPRAPVRSIMVAQAEPRRDDEPRPGAGHRPDAGAHSQAKPRLAAAPARPLVVAALNPGATRGTARSVPPAREPAGRPAASASKPAPEKPRTFSVAFAPPARPGSGKSGPTFSAQSIATLLSKYETRKDGAKPTRVSTLRRAASPE